jgi:hypothetical protein
MVGVSHSSVGLQAAVDGVNTSVATQHGSPSAPHGTQLGVGASSAQVVPGRGHHG